MSRGGGRRGVRDYLPLAYIAAAMLAAAVVLPSALRPPPDPANSSGAINPNAPPNQNPNQLLESLQEAGGGGAGGGSGGAATTLPGQRTVSGPAPTTTLPTVASLGYCYGNPPRQIPSVYAGPCVGAWQGNNGGVTSTNVFPNEIRIGVNNAGSPAVGRVPPASSDTASTDSTTIFWQVMQQYFNQHFQLYGRQVVFYGIPLASQYTASTLAADAEQDAKQYQIFVAIDATVGECEDLVRDNLVAICDPVTTATAEQYRPGLFSQYIGLDQSFDFGAEFACKSLLGRLARYGGPDVSSKPRKFGFLGWQGLQGGAPAGLFQTKFKSLCNGQVEVATQSGSADASGASVAVTRFKADGVTTIIFSNEGVNVLFAMQQANNLAYTPEWVELGEYADDTNLVAEAFPKDQSVHLFGMSSLEWPQVPAQTECYQAFHTVDPTANPGSCGFWVQLVLAMDGLQGAGPHLTPATFQQALFNLGERFGDPVWKIGGGFGPGNYAYDDSVGLMWYSQTATDPANGTPGAYMWIDGGHKFQHGQLPPGDAGFFTSGAPAAPGG